MSQAVSPEAGFCVAEALNRLIARENLPGTSIEALMEAVLAGQVTETDVAALLVAFRIKGETEEELAAGARVLRRHMVKLEVSEPGVLDTCGMGGDGSCTFNVSTATAFVAAGAGVPVVKHGNRSVSSRCGSSDVLTQLGIEPIQDPQRARHCLLESGCVFCFAPYYHPALKRFAELRRRLGIRTFFNMLGPLANPAGAEFQLLGVARPELLDPMAGALSRLGVSRAIVVCGADGMDEVSLAAPTFVRVVTRYGMKSVMWSADDFGVEPCSIAELRVESAAESAARIHDVLAGTDVPAMRIVVANTAAALLAAGRVTDLRAGVAVARESITSGRAREVLERVVHCTNHNRRSR
jgi:anthranilate phosphoribosyltransferase